MKLPVAQSAAEILSTFDAMEKPLDEDEIADALRGVIDKSPGLEGIERKGTLAELMAFWVMGGAKREASPWNTYFTPVASAVRENGTTIYIPDLSQADSEVIEHWKARSAEVTHPVLRARYSDLVWEFCKQVTGKKPEISFTHAAIDAYLEAVEHKQTKELHQSYRYIARALGLALSIGDSARAERAKRAAFDLRRQNSQPLPGKMWWMLFDLLVEDNNVDLTEAERAEIISDLENILRVASNSQDPAVFDPWITNDASERLVRLYRSPEKPVEMRRVIEIAGRSFEAAAANADPLVALSWLQMIYDRYMDAGMSQDAVRVQLAMAEKGRLAKGTVKRTEIKVPIDPEEIEKWLNNLTEGGIEQSLTRIAMAFLPRADKIRSFYEQMAENAPLLSRIPIVKSTDTHITARIGSQDDDPEGRLVHQISERIGIESQFLATVLDRARSRHSITPESVVDFLMQSPVFEQSRRLLLTEGIAAYMTGDHIKAIHVLVPQIEHAVRVLLASLGSPTTTRGRTTGTMVTIGMGEALFKPVFRDLVDRNLWFYLLALYVDPRGLNLRNQLAHGLMPSEQLARPLSDWVIHTLLVIGCLRVEAGNTGAA